MSLLEKIKELMVDEMQDRSIVLWESEKDMLSDAIGTMLDELSDAINDLYGETAFLMQDIRDECGSYYQDGEWRIKGYSNEDMHNDLAEDLVRFEHFQKVISGTEKTDV